MEFRSEESVGEASTVATMRRARAMDYASGRQYGTEPRARIDESRPGRSDHAKSGRSAVPGNGNCRLPAEPSMPR